MIEVTIDSVRVSLTSQHRIVVLKDTNRDRFLPIWIGPCEADAITVELQEMPPQRPLTHDLLKTVIREMGGRVAHILISDLRNDVYYARIVVEVNGRQMDIDSRSSDAIALAVRMKAPIFVAEAVMDRAGVEPDEDVTDEAEMGVDDDVEAGVGGPMDEGRLSAFRDFVDSLNIDDLPGDDN